MGALEDPTLELATSGTLVAATDDWMETQEMEIMDTGLAPSDLHESAILATLAPGAYTAILKGNAEGSGVGLVEVYNLVQN